MAAEFGRLITAMVTPMAASGEVDYAGAAELAQALVASGSEGLVVTGSTGEGPTLTSDEIYSAFLGDPSEQKTFFHGHTFCGNPLAAAAALASLELFEEDETLEKLSGKIDCLGRALKPIAELPHVGEVRQKGMIVGIELVRDRETREAYAWSEQVGARVCGYAREQGLLLRPLGNVIVLMPPLAISHEQIEWMCNVVFEAIVAVSEIDAHDQMTEDDTLKTVPQQKYAV